MRNTYASSIGNEVIRGNFASIKSIKSIKSQGSDFLPLRYFDAHSDFLPLRHFMGIVVIFVIFRLFDILLFFLCFLFFFALVKLPLITSFSVLLWSVSEVVQR